MSETKIENREARVRISNLIQKLKTLQDEYGDLEVCSVNYHSDYYDVPLIQDDEDQVSVTIDEEGSPYLLIYGGSY